MQKIKAKDVKAFIEKVKQEMNRQRPRTRELPGLTPEARKWQFKLTSAN